MLPIQNYSIPRYNKKPFYWFDVVRGFRVSVNGYLHCPTFSSPSCLLETFPFGVDVVFLPGFMTSTPSILPWQNLRVLICVGSGGVGKTTLSAALAVLGALSGRKVLAITIDPAKRLADALGLSAFANEITSVPAANLLTLAEQLHLPLASEGSLDVMMVEQKRAFDEMVYAYAPDHEHARRVLQNSIYRHISASLPGAHEYAAMAVLEQQLAKNDYDLVVLDTPPTANALDFLAAPEKVIHVIDSPALSWFVKPYLSKSKWMGMGGTFFLKGLAKFVGSAFLEEMAQFFVEFHPILIGFQSHAVRIKRLLSGPNVKFAVVCSPEPGSVEEAITLHKHLQRSQLPTWATLVNRVHIKDDKALPFELILQTLQDHPAFVDWSTQEIECAAQTLETTYHESQLLAEQDHFAIKQLEQVSKAPVYPIPLFAQDIHGSKGMGFVCQALQQWL